METRAIRKILVPTDFSTCAEYALRYAVDMARALGAEVRICHASARPDYQVPNLVSPAMAAAAASMVDQLQQVFAAAEHEVQDLVDRHRGDGVPISGTNADGEIDEAITHEAKAWGADMIVIGSHGRRGVSRILLGSVAERVVRHAPCPVLVVHPKA